MSIPSRSSGTSTSRVLPLQQVVEATEAERSMIGSRITEERRREMMRQAQEISAQIEKDKQERIRAEKFKKRETYNKVVEARKMVILGTESGGIIESIPKILEKKAECKVCELHIDENAGICNHEDIIKICSIGVEHELFDFLLNVDNGKPVTQVLQHSNRDVPRTIPLERRPEQADQELVRAEKPQPSTSTGAIHRRPRFISRPKSTSKPSRPIGLAEVPPSELAALKWYPWKKEKKKTHNPRRHLQLEDAELVLEDMGCLSVFGKPVSNPNRPAVVPRVK